MIINRIGLRIGLAIALVVSASFPVQAQKLRVGATGAAPFFIQESSTFKDISLEIWQGIDNFEGLEYEVIPQDNFEKALLDLVIGSLSISASLPVQAQKLQGGTARFFMEENSTFKGISVEIWQEIANSEGFKYEVIPQKNVETALDALVNGELDLVIGPLSITAERLEKVEFTQPYFEAEMGLMLPGQPPSLWSLVEPFFQFAVISSVGVLVCSLFVVGNLLWLAERRCNSEKFPKEYLKGVGNGMWFALVTLTTVGYGDIAPVTKIGRLIASVWMVITMVAASSLTAVLATAFTLSLSQQPAEKFRRPEDLQGTRMAVVSGTTGVKWADHYQARLIETDKLEDAIALLLADKPKAEGVIFDVPQLRYYLHQHPQAPLRVAQFFLATENYGFVVPLDSALLQPLNVRLLQLQQEGRIKRIEEQWLE